LVPTFIANVVLQLFEPPDVSVRTRIAEASAETLRVAINTTPVKITASLICQPAIPEADFLTVILLIGHIWLMKNAHHTYADSVAVGTNTTRSDDVRFL